MNFTDQKVLKKSKSVAIIIAHPNDETLWVGGTILSHPAWKCFIVCLCQGNNPEQATRFYNTLAIMKSEGVMGNLDDGPEQNPLDEKEVETAILDLLPKKHFDLIISHNPGGEYTRHIRHEEIGKAVINLWHSGKISTDELWAFAYEDGNKKYYPKPIETVSNFRPLLKRIWQRKYSIITETYGCEKSSWEAETTTKAEAFWRFSDPSVAQRWLKKTGF
jgi:LmbE family N-acetylglucosaminyl deacetylase